MKKYTGLFVLLLLIPLVSAQNNPGHDSLYVIKSGDIMTGSLDVVGDVNATVDVYGERIRPLQEIFTPNLIIKGDGTTSTATRRIVATPTYLEIVGDEIRLNYDAGGAVKIGSIGTETELLVRGIIKINNTEICLADGTNCPDLGSGEFEGILPVTSGGTGASTAVEARTNLGAGTMSNWILSASGTAGTQTISQGTEVSFEAGTGTTITRAGSTIIINATGTGGTITNIATNNGITGGPITTTGTIGLTGQALALHNLSTTGMIVRTGADAVTTRTITQGTGIIITNGDGVSGNPVITLNTTYTDGLYLQVSGDTMSGTLNMGNQKITNLQNGTDSQDAVTYSQLQEIDTKMSGDYVPYTGATKTVDLGSQNLVTTGNIGIGTADPNAKLDIDGNIRIANNQWISARNAADTGTINMFKVNANNQIDVGATLNIGSLVFAQDSGLITAMDMPVTSAPSPGSMQGYSFKVDGNNMLVIYSEADGSGGTQNRRVGIGTNTPSTELHVEGDITADAALVNYLKLSSASPDELGIAYDSNTGDIIIGNISGLI